MKVQSRLWQSGSQSLGKEWGAARDGNTLSRRGERRYRSIGKDDETAQEDRVTKVASTKSRSVEGIMLVVPSKLVMFGINKPASCSRCFGYARRHPATSSEHLCIHYILSTWHSNTAYSQLSG